MKMINVLITGSGGQASQSIIKCLRLANLNKKRFRIITTDIDSLLPGVYRGDKGYLIPKSFDKFILSLNNIITEEKIDIVIPGSDIEIDFLSPNRDKLQAPLLLASDEVVKIARDKWETAEWLRKNNFPYPRTYLGIPEILKFPDFVPYPVIIKPRHGWGSNDLFKVNNIEELKGIKTYLLNRWKEEEFVTQELMTGQELSGMVMIAKDKEILAITCAESWKKFGMSYKTIHGSENDDLDFKLLASKVMGRLGAIGPVSLQAFRITAAYNKRSINIFELNPRFTGAQIVRALGGINGPEILVDNWMSGKKSYPTIHGKFVALWHSDYIYLPWNKFLKLVKKKEITRTGDVIKLL